jgi:hypothetical protein
MSQVLLKSKVRFIALLFMVLLIGTSASFTVAIGAQSERTPVTSTGTTNGPVANPESAEHGLSQKAVEIGRIFSFPIMVTGKILTEEDQRRLAKETAQVLPAQ